MSQGAAQGQARVSEGLAMQDGSKRGLRRKFRTIL